MNYDYMFPFTMSGGYWYCLIVIGVLIDWGIGDPRWLPHPIILMGKVIGFLNKKLNKGTHKKAKGFLLLFLVLFLTFAVVLGIQILLLKLNVVLYLVFNLYLIVTSLAAKTLATEVRKVWVALTKLDITEARVQVGYLVGRDTQKLSREEITRATVETTAENTIDGILAPLFFLFLGVITPWFCLNPGVLVMAYKAVNTLDSMVGYIQEPYKDFGFASAKFDDILNFIPARVGSYFMLVAGMFLGFDIKQGHAIFKRDRKNHKSPNSGHPESVVAGLLGIQLGGDNRYFGQILKKPTIGEAKSVLVPEDIRDTISIMYGSEILVMLFSVVVTAIVLAF